MKIRTITCGLKVDFENWSRAQVELEKAVEALNSARKMCETAGYEVQTVRISLAPFLGIFAGPQNKARRNERLSLLSVFCERAGIDFVSLGPHRAGELEATEAVELIANFPAFNISTFIAENGQILSSGIFQASRIISGLAGATQEGMGNFRYCAIACCPPGIPFFPAAYHSPLEDSRPTLSLGMQMPDVAFETISALAPSLSKEGPQLISGALAKAVKSRLIPLQDLMLKYCDQNQNFGFAGTDLSLAPLGGDSVVEAIEAAGLGLFGEAGTLALVAAITAGLKLAGSQEAKEEKEPSLLSTGYSGLMLPVLEDALLGQRALEGKVDIQKLLMYSAVCGTGLDVVPLPGATTEIEISRLLFDVATLSARYNKPLSARLFPVPGKKAGEITTFNSPYLTNTQIMAL